MTKVYDFFEICLLKGRKHKCMGLGLDESYLLVRESLGWTFRFYGWLTSASAAVVLL